MRTAFAILFSALLVLGQGVLPAATPLVKAHAQCGRCACGNKCCVGESAPVSAPQPATPANVLPLKQFQATLLSAAPIYSLPDFPAAATFFDYCSSCRSTTVPLYEWNCAYLI